MDALRALVDFILHIDVHLSQLAGQYGPWLYGILALIVFCETGLVVMPFLPGDSLLFAAGALAASGAFNVHLLAVIIFCAALLGDTVNYTVGRQIGGRVARSRFVKPQYLARTQAFYDRHGGRFLVLARFVPIVRTFAPFVAGTAEMPFPRFISYSLAGGVALGGTVRLRGLFLRQPAVRQGKFRACRHRHRACVDPARRRPVPSQPPRVGLA